VLKKSVTEQESLAGFKKFCSTLRIEGGKPLKLYPEQLAMLEDYFKGIRETLILISKKNGKTTLMAAVALYHLLTNPDAYCVIGASSEDQATILYHQAARMIARSELEEVFHAQKGYRRITLRSDGGTIRVMASDASTADGVLPTLALVDELHRHKNGDLYGVFRDGLAGRAGRMITISTAGDDIDSPLGLLRQKAYALPGLRRDGPYRCVRSENFVMHEWALDDDQDRDDLALVKTANPAPWQTVKELRIRKESPSMTPWQWARFACGVWMFGETGAFSENEWRACEDPDAVIPEGVTGVVIGVDLGWRWDTTAIIPVWPDDGRLVVGQPTIIVPPRDGTMTPYQAIWDALEELSERFSYPLFVIDPEAGGEQLAQQIDGELNGEVVEHSQKPATMALAAQRLSEAIGAKKLAHRGYPELTKHVLAAAPKSVGEGWRLVKPKRSGAVIDGAIALAMAVSVATGETESEPLFAFV
jgi:phage terminase large subunit-like protein